MPISAKLQWKRTGWVALGCLCAVWLGMAAGPAPGAEGAEPHASVPQRIEALCRESKGRFQPITPQLLAQTKAQLAERFERLDRRLDLDGQNGRAWREYLLWDLLAEQLAAAKLDPAVLLRVLERYEAEHQGLALVWFVEVRDALRRYHRVLQASDDPQISAVCDQVLDALAQRLQTAWPRLEPADARFVGQATGWLADLGQAPGVTAAVRAELAQPNLWINCSAELVAAGIARPVDRTGPVSDVILGTDIRGSGNTKGRTRVEFVPSDRFAVIDVILQGATQTKTTGYHGPARIHSDGVTRLGVRKRLWLDAQGLHTHRAAARAHTETETTGISVGRRGRLACRVAWRRTMAQKELAEQIAAQHASEQAQREMDREAEQALEPAREHLEERLRKPLARRGWLPDQLRFQTTSDALRVVACFADVRQLAAPTPPPEPRVSGDLTARVHESLVNNLAETLAGRRVDREEFESILVELLGKVPEPWRADHDEAPWAVLFAPSRPAEVCFDDEQLKIVIRADGYEEAGETHPGMDVRAVYRVVEGSDGFELVRQGKLQITPPEFDPGAGDTLTPRQIATRTILERRFEKLLKPRFVFEPISLPGAWEQAGELLPVDVRTQQGWLSLVLRRQDSPASRIEPE